MELSEIAGRIKFSMKHDARVDRHAKSPAAGLPLRKAAYGRSRPFEGARGLDLATSLAEPHITTLLGEVRVPAGRLNCIGDAAADQHLVDRGLFFHLSDAGRSIPQVEWASLLTARRAIAVVGHQQWESVR